MPKKPPFQIWTEVDIGLIAERFRVLSEVSRLKLISASGKGERNVSELISATGLSQANVSKHLKILTNCGLLARRKQGIYVFYSTADPSVFKLWEVANDFGGKSNRTVLPLCRAKVNSDR